MLPLVTSYVAFLPHQLENTPCMFPASVIAHWPAFSGWQTPTGINLALLATRYGDQVVSVVDCSTSERSERLLSDVLALWEDVKGQHLYIKDCISPSLLLLECPADLV